MFSLSVTCKFLRFVSPSQHSLNLSLNDLTSNVGIGNIKNRDKIVINSILNLHTNIFKWLVNIKKDTIPQNSAVGYCVGAAISGSLEIIKYFLETKLEGKNIYDPFNILSNVDARFILFKAAMHNHLNIVTYLHSNDYPWGSGVYYFAAKGGSLEILKYLHENGCDKGRLEIYKFNVETCTKAAAENGHFEVLKYLRELGFAWNSYTMRGAAENGHLEIVKYLHENGCPWNDGVFNMTAAKGHFEVLKWLHENGCPWSEYAGSNAAAEGHFEILIWLRENGCPWDKYTCSTAAENGHFEILKWLHENGCPWDKNIWYGAVRKGHLDIMKYLRSINNSRCPLDEHAYDIATRINQQHVLQYLQECEFEVNSMVVT